MFALHWICALTLALVSCLCAQPVKRDVAELLEYISVSKTSVNGTDCAKNISLHSPINIREDCMSSALNCTIGGLNDLISKCKNNEDDDDDLFTEDLINILTELTKKKIPTSSSPKCSCKMYNQTDVKTFLDNMESQVQRLRSSSDH